MRVPLGWLADYVEITQTPEGLAERLTLLGMEVKAIERWGAEWRSVVVGELLSVERHPNADRLSLTTVTVGAGEPLRIVCGATNIAPGQRVPVALPGAVLPGGRTIERATKMGVASEGMLCSGDELGLTSDAEGILILPPDAPLGIDLSALYGDIVLDVDVKPNRGDALSLFGLAREVAAATGTALRQPVITVGERGGPIEGLLTVVVEEPALCTRFVGRWVSGVTVGPSPERVQMRLRAAGLRPISNVVDASNYVMLELGKPTHTFDAAGVHGSTIVVRRALPGERLETLDHVARDLDPETLVIADPEAVIGIAGIMGGAASEVSERTRDIVIESAIFDPVSIRRTGQRFGLRSEASLRFEKGQDVPLARIGADRVAQLIVEWAGGAVARGRIDTAPLEPGPARVAFRPERVNRLLGTAFTPDEQRGLLARVEIETEPAPAGTLVPVAAGESPLAVDPGSAETLVALVPTWRREIQIEADVAEEVARMRGYEVVPAALPNTTMPSFRPTPLEPRDLVRDTLVGAGVTEAVSHALVSPDHDAALGWPDDGPPLPSGETEIAGEPIRVRNPLSVAHSVLRRHVVGSLLDLLAWNERQGRSEIALFEVGKGYGRDGGLPREWWRLAFVLAGEAAPPAWNRPSREVDLDDAKAIVELLANRLGAGAPSYERDGRGLPFHPGRAATVVIRGSDGSGEARAGQAARPEIVLSGHVAELHPAVVERWGIRTPRVYAAELAVRGLSAGRLTPVRARPVPRVPAVERDLAPVVPEDRGAAEIARAIRDAGGPLLREVRLFDVYRGAPLADGEKSLAFRLLFQAEERTLTEAEVDAAVADVSQALTERLGARLRT